MIRRETRDWFRPEPDKEQVHMKEPTVEMVAAARELVERWFNLKVLL